MRISELVERFGGELDGDGSVEIAGVTGVEFAGPDDVTFATDEKLLQQAEASPACGVIVPQNTRPSQKPLIRCDSPESYAADVLGFFHAAQALAPGIHSSAIIEGSAEVADSATIGPHVTVGRDCRIGPGVLLMASVTVGDECEIGADTVIHPSATIYRHSRVGARVLIHAGAVIGGDGFGFFIDRGRARRWPHIGNVVIEDDVEIGANTCVDRARFGTTLIQRGAKIDNLVQVAHNCRVGPGALLAAQVGLAGSVVLEEGVVCAGQAGVVEHVTVGRGTQLGARTCVIGDIPAGSVEWGTPSRPRQRVMAEQAVLGFLAENRRALRKLIRQAEKE